MDIKINTSDPHFGQKKRVHVSYLHVLKSMEEHKLKTSTEKQESSDQLMTNARVIKGWIRDQTYFELARI